MTYKFKNTTATQLLAKLREEIMQCIEVDNSLLPLEYQNHRDGVRSLAELDSMYQESNEPSQHVKNKAIKAENIANYRKQVEENGEFEYNGHRDELQLHKNEMAMVAGMVSGGLIEEEDLQEK